MANEVNTDILSVSLEMIEKFYTLQNFERPLTQVDVEKFLTHYPFYATILSVKMLSRIEGYSFDRLGVTLRAKI